MASVKFTAVDNDEIEKMANEWESNPKQGHFRTVGKNLGEYDAEEIQETLTQYYADCLSKIAKGNKFATPCKSFALACTKAKAFMATRIQPNLKQFQTQKPDYEGAMAHIPFHAWCPNPTQEEADMWCQTINKYFDENFKAKAGETLVFNTIVTFTPMSKLCVITLSMLHYKGVVDVE